MDYLLENPNVLFPLFVEHLQLTVITLLIAIAIALPLGVWLTRQREVQGPILGILSILYTIPSLALLVLLIPFFGLGMDTGIAALVIYAQVVLVRNIVTGLEGVPKSVIEAARGMGMNPWQIFWQIEMPLALPVMLAGLRVATLSTIGIGAIAALVGAGGLGEILFQGIQQNREDKIIAGAITVSTLAIGANVLIRVAEGWATRSARL
jgi:osmoprotectant transport system permease protein